MEFLKILHLGSAYWYELSHPLLKKAIKHWKNGIIFFS